MQILSTQTAHHIKFQLLSMCKCYYYRKWFIMLYLCLVMKQQNASNYDVYVSGMHWIQIAHGYIKHKVMCWSAQNCVYLKSYTLKVIVSLRYVSAVFQPEFFECFHILSIKPPSVLYLWLSSTDNTDVVFWHGNLLWFLTKFTYSPALMHWDIYYWYVDYWISIVVLHGWAVHLLF